MAFQHNDDNGGPEFQYSGTDQLVRIEKAMARYNAWIVGMVIDGYGGKINPTTRVLDFGAGLGTLSQIFYDKSSVRPDTFDLDPVHRQEMTRRGFHAYSRFDDLPADYDLIFVSNVLEHIEDDVDLLYVLKGKLKQDAKLVIYVPAFQSIWTTMDEKVGHIRRYHKKELCEKLGQTGYSVQQVRYCDSLGFLLAFLFKFIGNKNGDLPLRSLYLYDRLLLPISRVMDMVALRFWGKNLFVVARK